MTYKQLNILIIVLFCILFIVFILGILGVLTPNTTIHIIYNDDIISYDIRFYDIKSDLVFLTTSDGVEIVCPFDSIIACRHCSCGITTQKP